MRVHDVEIDAVVNEQNWRLKAGGDELPNMIEWKIEKCLSFAVSDTIMYSALTIVGKSEVRPLLLNREVGTYEWWGNMCEYVAGAWGELGRAESWESECYVAKPLAKEPLVMGECSHDKKRAGFSRWRNNLREVHLRPSLPFFTLQGMPIFTCSDGNLPVIFVVRKCGNVA
ncbi:MAG: hypothetical protein HC897_01350 [Thermoanaerobaculia bacterium]|nr:hypothetical protein [Thermoanaerobaculia bacterium]